MDTDDGPGFGVANVLYGQGLVICFTLIGLCSVAKWSYALQPTPKGFIDADLVAFAVYATLIGVRLIVQICRLNPSASTSIVVADIPKSPEIDAIEASLGVIEIYMQICIVLFILASISGYTKRAVTVAFLGTSLLAARIFLRYHVNPLTPSLDYLSGNFLFRFGIMFTIAASFLALWMTLALEMTLLWISTRSRLRRPLSDVRLTEITNDGTQTQTLSKLNESAKEPPNNVVFALTSVVSAFASLAVTTAVIIYVFSDGDIGLDWRLVTSQLVSNSRRNLAKFDQMNLAFVPGSLKLTGAVISLVNERCVMYLDRNERLESTQLMQLLLPQFCARCDDHAITYRERLNHIPSP